MPSKELTIFRVHMREALLAAKKGEGELAVLYQEVANDVTAKVHARGDRVNALELQGDIDKAFEQTLFKRVKAVRTSIEDGAKLGPKASRKTMRAVYGEEVARAQVRANPKALKEAANRIAGKTTVDGVALTKRMRRVDREVASEMAREVEKGVRQKKGILGAARQIEKLDPREVRLPKYLQQVEDAARAGNLDELKALTKRYTAHVRANLGELQADLTRKASKFSLRSATTRFLADIEKAGPKGIDKVVARYVKDKAAFRANLIARHETVEAFRRSYIEQTKNKPGVIGMRWQLSPTRHPVPDECDLYANQNAYKLGPGVYPGDKVPRHPHPACLCSITAVIDREHFSRQRADNDNAVPARMRDEKSPDAVGWLKANEQIAAKILGPTRHALFKQGVNVLDREGKPLLVRDLLQPMRQKMAVGASEHPWAAPQLADRRSVRPQAAVRRRPKPRAKTPGGGSDAPARERIVGELYHGDPAPDVERAAQAFESVSAHVRELHASQLAAPVPELLSLANETASGIEKALGLRQVRSIRSVAPHTEGKRYAGLMFWDGRMKLRVTGPKASTYRILVHETMHTFGGATARAYDGVGIVLEESATEELTDAYLGGTWHLAKRGARLDLSDTERAYSQWLHRPHEWRGEGLYASWRGRIMSLVSAATGEVDAVTISRHVRGAFLEWKRASYDSPAAALQGFIDALEPSEEQRRFYERAMSSPKSWKVL